MDTSQKSIADEIMAVLTRFKPTDEIRNVTDSFLYKKINQAREEAAIETYKQTGVIDQAYIQDLGMVDFHRVNFADDIAITSAECDISKATLPQMISLISRDGNQDLGVNILSANGKTKYYPYNMTMWNSFTPERELFRYYFRMNTTVFVNHLVDKLRVFGLFQNPEDAILVNSTPVSSGSLVNGTSYTVKYDQIIYNGAVKAKDSTFTAGATTTFTGQGKVYLTSQITDFQETSPYPVPGDMARKIVLDVLMKEFGIEIKMTPDTQNDSRDDATKGKV